MTGGAPGGVGGAWRQDAEKWLNRGGAGRSREVLAEPVALQSPEVAQRRRSQRQGSESTQHQKVHEDVQVHDELLGDVEVRKHPAPEGALRLTTDTIMRVMSVSSESTQHQKVH